MKYSEKYYLQIKLVISLSALIIVIFHLILPNLKIDSIALGLLVVAALPWFSDLIQSAELPGGWKMTFRELKDKQEKIVYEQEEQAKTLRKQSEEIKQIKRISFLMNSFLSSEQLKCLTSLNNGTKYPFDKKSGVVEQAKDDIRRLFAAGLITRIPKKGFRTLFEQGDQTQDVGEHFCITEQGKLFLELLNESDS